MHTFQVVASLRPQLRSKLVVAELLAVVVLGPAVVL